MGCWISTGFFDRESELSTLFHVAAFHEQLPLACAFASKFAKKFRVSPEKRYFSRNETHSHLRFGDGAGRMNMQPNPRRWSWGRRTGL
jgi:hypothetical protein